MPRGNCGVSNGGYALVTVRPASNSQKKPMTLGGCWPVRASDWDSDLALGLASGLG